jgi:hypothetical protein
MVTRYSCGHVGRENDSYLSKVQKAFIRVAEIRNERVESESKSCPDCKGR